MQTEQYIETYFSDLKKVIDALPRATIAQVYQKLDECQRSGKTLFVFGNGGSGATASHIVCDMGKNTRGSAKPRLRVVGLNDNMAIFSAYANDEGYDRVFAEQIISLGDPGDLVLAISGSGNSPNVLEGIRAAKEKGMFTIGLTGYSGGKMKDLVDLPLVVPVNDMEQIEDVHMILDHLITGLLRGGRYEIAH
ncbi:MAG: SIS domain-containing protein [Chloroflexi bacterium]|nr:SIS domain-containing protein [Chloroflexota bacterium]